MAALGTLPTSTPRGRPARLPITEYDVNKGLRLGPITLRADHHRPNSLAVSNYIVRQLRVVYRQLWPDHGQRFPQ